MRETTFYDGWVETLTISVIVLSLFATILLFGLWWQYRNRKKEPDTPSGYTFKSYVKWYFDGFGGDVFKVLKWGITVVLVIVAIAAAIIFIPLAWGAITAGIDAISVKGILIVIAVLLTLIVLKLRYPRAQKCMPE
ncbi:MAG: hypothetical protein HGB32_03640 [Geobacteraceae bacterium]|nr:hypothetical protein [Geobacteraceae bacterium]NTW79225.1 hypothetical protein [Geobacteraceae bacterium]